MMIASMQNFTGAFSQADFFGKLIFLSLFALSLLCWVVLLYKWWLIRNVRSCSSRFIHALLKKKEPLFNVRVDTLPQMLYKELPHPFASLLAILKEKTKEVLDKNHFFAGNGPDSAVYLSRSDIELIEMHLHSVMVNQRERLEKHLFLLPMITSLAPFLGLLGTVWGILITFGGLQTQGMVGSNTAILGGLSTALATTVLGLLIAIPSLVAYSCLKSAIHSYFSEMEGFSHQLLSTVEIQYRKVEIT